MFDIYEIQNPEIRAENRELARIRHTETSYNQYDCFYYVGDGKYRKSLNALCGKKLRKQITDDDFLLGCKDIERNVNLNRRCNQKQFIKMRSAELATIMPDASASSIKKQAYEDMRNILQQQYNRNQRRHTCKVRILENTCG